MEGEGGPHQPRRTAHSGMMTTPHGTERILLCLMMMSPLAGTEMSHVGVMYIHHSGNDLHPVVVMIFRAVGMSIPGDVMNLLAVGIALPYREIIDHVGGMSSPAGLRTHLIKVRTPPSDGPSPHGAKRADTVTHAESWLKSEWTVLGRHVMNRNATGRVDQDPRACCVLVGVSTQPHSLSHSGWPRAL